MVQNHPLDKSLKIRGKSLFNTFRQDYFTDLVEEFYRSGEQEDKCKYLVARMLSNFYVGLSHPKLQLKLFYLLCSKVIKYYKLLKDNGVAQYYAAKQAIRAKVEDTLFGNHSGAEKPQIQPESSEPSQKLLKQENSYTKTAVDTHAEWLQNVEELLKLINLMLGDQSFLHDLASTLFDRDESKLKVKALRSLASTLYDMMDLDNDIISFQSTLLLKHLFTIVNVQREVAVDDNLNLPRQLWNKLMMIEMGTKDHESSHHSQFKTFFILQTLNETFKINMSNKTSNSTSELMLNSALGKTLISLIHRYMSPSINYQCSSLLLKYLKSVASKGRLEADQSFFNNYTVVLLKHLLLTLGKAGIEQKKISSEIIFHLVSENPICLNFITRLLPKSVFRKLRGGLNLADIAKWKSQDWYNAVELVSEELDKIGQTATTSPAILLGGLRDYIARYYQDWEKISEDVLSKVFDNVIHHRANNLSDIVKIVQTRHNFEEFELNYSKHLDQVHVGKYVLADLYNHTELAPELLTEITEPEVFYQELKNFYINQKTVSMKIEALKVMTLLYRKYPLRKIQLMPYFLNEFNHTEDPFLHYHLIQFFISLTDCKEPYTRAHNLTEFFKSSFRLYRSRPLFCSKVPF